MKPRDRIVRCVREGEFLNPDSPDAWRIARRLEVGRGCSLLELRPATLRERIELLYRRPNIDRIGQRMSRLADGGPSRVEL